MAAPESQRAQRYGRVALRLMLVSLILLFLTSLLLLGTSAIASASQQVKTGSQLPAVPEQTDTPVPTDTPAENTPTAVPTDTPVTIAPTATTPYGDVPTSTAASGDTPAGTGSGTVGTGTGGPQPTEVGLAQPTVSNGTSDPSQGISASNFGTNGLLITTLVGCVLAVLGITIGAFALNALVRSGYGPFLRALVRGNRRSGRVTQPSQRGRGARLRRPPGSSRPDYDDRYDSRSTRDSGDSYGDPADYSGGRPRPTSRDSRQERPGTYSGDRYRR